MANSPQIAAFASALAAFNTRDQAAVVALQAKFKTMQDLIDTLQNTPGPISPEDQATLDSLQAQAGTFADGLEALASTTPPTPPAA